MAMQTGDSAVLPQVLVGEGFAGMGFEIFFKLDGFLAGR